MFHGVACPGLRGSPAGLSDASSTSEAKDSSRNDDPAGDPRSPGECVSGRTSAPAERAHQGSNLGPSA